MLTDEDMRRLAAEDPHTVIREPCPSKGCWHVALKLDGRKGWGSVLNPMTGHPILWACNDGRHGLLSPDDCDEIEITSAPDEAIEALERAGYVFTDRR